jgi:rSAM/selenodomain-associated transferase 1
MNAILLLLKYPTPGRVKTRLAATVGAEAAVKIYRQMVETLCQSLPENATPILVYDPPGTEEALRHWLTPHLNRSISEKHRQILWLPQCEGDLGARLSAAFEFAFCQGFKQVAAIGTDCLDVNPALFDEVFTRLEGRNVVIGPAWDGGYYLIATASHQPCLFQNIPWSSAQTFSETLTRAAAENLRVFLLEKYHDIDTEEDWQRALAQGTLTTNPAS